MLAGKIPWTEEACKSTVHGVTKSQTQLSDICTCIKYKREENKERLILLSIREGFTEKGIFTGFVRKHRSVLCYQGKERLCR